VGIEYQTIDDSPEGQAEARETQRANRVQALRSLEHEHLSLTSLGDDATKEQRARIEEIEKLLPGLQKDPLVQEGLAVERQETTEAEAAPGDES
jgi:DnaJ-domain-containing protein 1